MICLQSYYDRNVALLLHHHEGNVVLTCINGRSRSPMFLVAYLILCGDMESEDAMSVVGDALFLQRGEVLDRFGSLEPAMVLLQNRVNVCM